MPYADHVFFKNLLTLSWSADQLSKIVLLGHSFGTMVKMLELSISKQEKFGVTEQREKVRKLLAIKEYVNEFELCSELDGFCGDDCPYDELANESGDSQEECGCMHCVANVERYAMISALPSEKIAIIGRETMRFTIIGLQTSTSLKRPLKRWHFVIHDIWSF